MKAEIEIKGDEQAVEKLKSVRSAVEQMEVFHKAAAVIVDKWIQKNFQTGGGNVGGWKPLNIKTIKRRRKGSSAILQDTGNLRSRWKAVVTRNEMRYQSGVSYGIYHDRGTKNIPQRRIIPKVEEISDSLRRAMEWFLKEAKRR